MTIVEMQTAFMIKLRQFIAEPDIESDDIEYYINRAQEEFVKEQHFVIRDNLRNQNLGDISIQRAIENIRTLISQVDAIYTTTDPDLDNHFVASTEFINGAQLSLESTLFTNAYAYYLRSRLLVVTNDELTCRIIDPLDMSKFIKTRYNQPLFRQPAILVEGKIIKVVYPSDVTLVGGTSKLMLSYITNPTPVSIGGTPANCLLPDHTHNEIVDRGVELKLTDLQKARQLGIDKSAFVPSQAAE